MHAFKRVLFVVMTLGLLLTASCKPQVVVQTVEVIETVQVQATVEVPVEVPVEVQVTPTTRPPVTIKILNFSQEQTAFYQEAAQVFQQEYPWITVQWDTLAQTDYNETLPLMFQSGDAPDIFVYYAHRGTYFELAELLEVDWVQPYDDAALDPGFRERFYNTRNLMEPIYGRDGKIYSIPRDAPGPYEHGYMWFNKSIFQAAGLDPVADVPTTWDELKEVCRTIRANTDAYCLSIPNNDAGELHRIMIPWLAVNGAGADWRSWDTGLTDASSPEVVEVVEKLREFYVEDLVLPGINDKNFARAAIANGAAAIYFDGSWIASVWATNYGYYDPGVALYRPRRTKTGIGAKSLRASTIPTCSSARSARTPTRSPCSSTG
jgi:ABC-type glycerol-3-phosphate transport system substrate-binding protein